MLNRNSFIYKATAVIIYICLFTAPVHAAPSLTSKYYCLMDCQSGQIILSKNGGEIRQVASTTKMMTGILTVEYADLDEIATVSLNADKTPEYTIGLRTGQEISVGELLKVALIKSSNDAAVVLAEHVAGDESFFAHLMSKKSFALGAMNTHFQNASGLPANEHYSTAFDLAQIGRYALAQTEIKRLVATRQTEFKHPSYSEPLIINNTNNLLHYYKGADGIKTGTADISGKCLVASATRNGRQLIAVALKSGDRSTDCARLLDYGFNNTSLSKVLDSTVPFKTIKIANGSQDVADIFPAEDVYLWVGPESPNIEKKVKMNYAITAPVKQGEKVGTLEIYADGKMVKSINLVCGQDIKKRSGLLSRMIRDFVLP